MTINLSNNLDWWLLKIALFAALILADIAIVSSQWAASEPMIATAAAFDLVITIPIVYFLLIRTTSIPKITVVPVFGASVLAAYFLVPPSGQIVVSSAMTYAIPVVEVFAVGYIALRLGRIIRAYRNGNDEGFDVMERLRTSFSKELSPASLGRAAAFEAGGIAFAFGKWRKPKTGTQFSYHRNAMAVLTAFLFLLAAETVVVHAVISRWSSLAAWIITGLSVYFGFQLFGHLKAAMLRPICLTKDHLLVRCGLLADCQIELDRISEVTRCGTTDPVTDNSLAITPAGPLLRPNVRLTLLDAATVYGFYGLPKTTNSLDIYVDDPDTFVEAIRNQVRLTTCHSRQ